MAHTGACVDSAWIGLREQARRTGKSCVRVYCSTGNRLRHWWVLPAQSAGMRNRWRCDNRDWTQSGKWRAHSLRVFRSTGSGHFAASRSASRRTCFDRDSSILSKFFQHRISFGNARCTCAGNCLWAGATAQTPLGLKPEHPAVSTQLISRMSKQPLAPRWSDDAC